MPLERHTSRPEGMSRPGPVGRHPEGLDRAVLPRGLEALVGKGRGRRGRPPARP
jgi:hypothetical protein